MSRSLLSDDGNIVLTISIPTTVVLVLGSTILMFAGILRHESFKRYFSSWLIHKSLSKRPLPKVEHYVSRREKRFAHYRLLDLNAIHRTHLHNTNDEKFARFRELIVAKYTSNNDLHESETAELCREAEGEIEYTRKVNQRFIDELCDTNAVTYDIMFRLIENHHAEQWSFDRHVCREDDTNMDSPCNNTIAQVESLHVEVARRTEWVHADIEDWSVRRCVGIVDEADQRCRQTTSRNSRLYIDYCQEWWPYREILLRSNSTPGTSTMAQIGYHPSGMLNARTEVQFVSILIDVSLPWHRSLGRGREIYKATKRNSILPGGWSAYNPLDGIWYLRAPRRLNPIELLHEPCWCFPRITDTLGFDMHYE